MWGESQGVQDCPHPTLLQFRAVPLPLSCSSISIAPATRLLCSSMSWQKELCRAPSLSGLGSRLQGHKAETPTRLWGGGAVKLRDSPGPGGSARDAWPALTHRSQCSQGLAE